MTARSNSGKTVNLLTVLADLEDEDEDEEEDEDEDCDDFARC